MVDNPTALNGVLPRHQFSKSDIRLAAHLFESAIKKYYGEVWQIKSDGEYKGVSWDCINPLHFDRGIWLLCQRAKHRGAFRAAGEIETRDSGYVLRFMLFFNPTHAGDKK